jgi:hypothetical protein
MGSQNSSAINVVQLKVMILLQSAISVPSLSFNFISIKLSDQHRISATALNMLELQKKWEY